MKISQILFIISFTIFGCNNPVKKETANIKNKKDSVKNEYQLINVFQDGIKTASYYYDKMEQLIKINEYLTNGDLDNEINFHYKNNELDFVSIGENNKSQDDWLSNYYKNIKEYNNFLIQKGIKVDKPFMIANEVSDLQNLITNIESFKKTNKKDGILFASKRIDLNVSFNPSTMEKFIPQNSKISYFEYSLNNAGFLERETIKFNDGILRIDYIYVDENIKEIVYLLKYSNKEKLKVIKKFDSL